MASLEVLACTGHTIAASTLAARKGTARPRSQAQLSSSNPRAQKRDCQPIEQAIFAGIPVNVTLLFSREQYLAAADAFMRGIERRIEVGLKADVGSVASVFVSRWDGAVAGKFLPS
jgi:transaldolase